MQSRITRNNDVSTSMDSKTHSSDDLQAKLKRSGNTPDSLKRYSKHSKLFKNPIKNYSIQPLRTKFKSTVCEIVEEDQLEEVEEKERPLNKIKMILDKREDLLFDKTRRKSLNNMRSRSTEFNLPKVIETKEEYSGFVEKRKLNIVKYFALIDKSDSTFVSRLLSQIEQKEEVELASEDPIEENPCEEGAAGEDDDDQEKSVSIKSSSLSRLSSNSFIKKKIIDEVPLFEREKEMSEIVE